MIRVLFFVLFLEGAGGDQEQGARARRDQLQHRHSRVRRGMPVAGARGLVVVFVVVVV